MRRALWAIGFLAWIGCAPAGAPRTAALEGPLLFDAEQLAECRAHGDYVLGLDPAVSYDEQELEAFRYLGQPERPGTLPPGLAAGPPAVAAIADFAAELQSVGVELLVVPIPSRLVLGGSVAGADPRALVRGELEFCGRLVDRGLHVLDLYTPFLAARRDMFLGRDFHWSPAGAGCAAERLASYFATRPWFSECFPERTFGELAAERVSVEIRPPGVAGEERRERVPVQRAVPAKGLTWQDRESPILVIGDSHLTIFDEVEADFARRLLVALGVSIDLISIPGGAPDRTRQALARRPTGVTGVASKRIVVWVFSVRDLPQEERWVVPIR